MGCLFGAHVATGSRTGSSEAAAIDYREKSLWGNTPSRRFDIQRVYIQRWDQVGSWPRAEEQDVAAKGRMMCLSLKNNLSSGQIKYNTIASGGADSYIDQWATKLKAYSGPKPIYLTLNHEVNASDKTSYASSSTLSVVQSEYRAAVQHWVTRMKNQGVTRSDVLFGYILTITGYPSIAVSDGWYPGNAYMDWVGVDGYNWYPCKPSTKWRLFDTIYSPWKAFHDSGHVASDKQWLICEIGCQEEDAYDARAGSYECSGFQANPSTAKADWFTNARNCLKGASGFPDYSFVDAVMYYDSPTVYNWWIDTRPGSLSAFAAWGNDAYFNGGSAPTTTTLAPSGLGSIGALGSTSLLAPSTISVSGLGSEGALGTPGLTEEGVISVVGLGSQGALGALRIKKGAGGIGGGGSGGGSGGGVGHGLASDVLDGSVEPVRELGSSRPVIRRTGEVSERIDLKGVSHEP